MGDLLIRRYRDSDRAAVWDLHNRALHAADAHGGHGPWDADLHDVSGVYVETGGEFLVGEADGRLVAMGALDRTDEYAAEIRRMRVDPAAWRRGYGRAMLEALQAQARDLGVRTLYLQTTARQEPAQALYRGAGYDETRRFDWRRFRVIEMAKALAEPWVVVRNARPEDAADLARVKPTEALHRDRIADAEKGRTHYLVADRRGEAVGCVFFVLETPDWAYRVRYVPMLFDIIVREDLRGRGIGTALVRRVEGRCREADQATLTLQVEPESNPRALALYRRLGYTPLQRCPYKDTWHFRDSGGTVHEGTEWIVDVQKRL